MKIIPNTAVLGPTIFKGVRDINKVKLYDSTVFVQTLGKISIPAPLLHRFLVISNIVSFLRTSQ